MKKDEKETPPPPSIDSLLGQLPQSQVIEPINTHPQVTDKKYKIRYLKLQRSDNQDEYVQIERMFLYIKGEKIPVSSGTVSPAYPDSSVGTWEAAARGTGTGITHTAASKNAFVQFDFGSEKEADRVQLVQRQDISDWNASRTKGLTFYALNGAGQPVLTYNIERPFTFELNFIHPGAVPFIRMGQTGTTRYRIRYLRLERTDNVRAALGVERMALYNGGQSLPVVTGELRPKLDNPLIGKWSEAAKGTGVAHTNMSTTAFIEFDFGSEVEADRVQLIQNQVLSDWNAERTKGSTFVAFDGARQPVLVYEIEQPFTFELNFTYPAMHPVVRLGK